ncbi:hypothetical protein GH714_037682 [Hevea brasiliensis]|uniref:NB-ARC domain-containing protein n=1 Tax=Hevea brasiliensis TaxID=3981 RepID=A0A6A6LPW5_HEVBR|nr:hypothetical protein GH714_037682 [Hevea brasiliensis]
MGNVFSIQCSSDALIGRCWDCIAAQPLYICQLEDDLQELETARDKLIELKNDVERKVTSEGTSQTVLLDRVRGWLSRVDATVTEVSSLLNRAVQERQKLCLAGCCSKNCKSTCMLGKSVSRSLKHVVALMSEGEFKEVVIRTHPKPVAVRKVNPTVGSETTLDEAWSCLMGDEVELLAYTRVDLGEIGVPLPTSPNRSKIVFTTRFQRVGRQMDAEQIIKLKPLDWEEDWEFFRKVGDILLDIVPLAQDGAKDCRGLPIALITTG